MSPRVTFGRRPPAARGVVLLEIVFALALFVTAAAVVGTALRGATGALLRMRLEARAMHLARSVLAEVATGRIALADTPPTCYDDDDPGWTYEIQAESFTDATDLKRVTVIVRSGDPLHCRPRQLTQWMFDAAAAGEPEEFLP